MRAIRRSVHSYDDTTGNFVFSTARAESDLHADPLGLTTVSSDVRGAGDLIRKSVLSWPGVEARPHRFGGTEYMFGRKEMGHVHGDRLADLPLPRKLHDQVIAAGRAQPHHVLPDTGWVSCWIENSEDTATVIELFRLQYKRYAASASAHHSR